MCGSSKTSETTVVNQQQQATPTAEETALNQRNLRMALATEGSQTQAQLAGLDLVNKMLAGSTNLPGIFGTLAKGISSEAIGNQATKYALNALPQFQSMGLTDSGVAGREISRGIANELLYPTEQFNIGSLQNLLNLALSGQAQVQSPIQANTNTLASSLAGLRSTTTSGTTSSTKTTPRDYVSPLLTGFGSAMGNWWGGS